MFKSDSLLDTFRPSSYACHTRLTTGGGGVLPRSRCMPGPSACSPGTLCPVTRGRYRLEWGRSREVINWRPSDPGHRLVILFPVCIWGAAYHDSTTSSWDRHRVVDAVMVSTWRIRSKLGPLHSDTFPVTTPSPAWDRPQPHYQLGPRRSDSSPLTPW